MAETTLQLGFVPKERGNYTSGTNYYKDNVVQYNGSSYIADPVGWSEDHPTDTYVTIAPTDISGNLNAGWKVFASGNNAFTTGEKVDSIGIDDEPTVGSNNLVKSGGVFTPLNQIEQNLGLVLASENITPIPSGTGAVQSDGSITTSATSYKYFSPILIKPYEKIVLNFGSQIYTGYNVAIVYECNSEGTFIRPLIIGNSTYRVVEYKNSTTNDIYVGICTYTSELRYSYYDFTKGTPKEIFNTEISNLENNLELIDDKYASALNVESILTQIESSFVSGKYPNYSSGAITTASSGNPVGYYIVSNNLLQNYQYIRVFISNDSNVSAAIAFYSSETTINSTTYLGGVQSANTTGKWFEGKVPDNAKVCLVCCRKTSTSLPLVPTVLALKKDLIVKDINDLKNAIFPQPYSEELLGTATIAANQTTGSLNINCKVGDILKIVTDSNTGNFSVGSSAYSDNLMVGSPNNVYTLRLNTDVKTIHFYSPSHGTSSDLASIQIYKCGKQEEYLYENCYDSFYKYIHPHTFDNSKFIVGKSWSADGYVAYGNRATTGLIYGLNPTINVSLSDTTNYRFYIFTYATGDNRLSDSGWKTSLNVQLKCNRFALTLEKKTGGNITQEDLDVISIQFEKYHAALYVTPDEFNSELNLFKEEVLSAIDKISNPIGSINNGLSIIKPYYYHYRPAAFITDSSGNRAIPSQTTFDIEMASRLGFTFIEANVQPTSDGHFICMHGDAGKFGNVVYSLDSTDISNVAINTKTLDWIKENVRYDSYYDKYKIAPPSLEEFCQCCKLNKIGVFAGTDNLNAINICLNILGTDGTILYNANSDKRASFKGMMFVWGNSSSTTVNDILTTARKYGMPFMYGLGPTLLSTLVSNNQLSSLVSQMHAEGFTLASTAVYDTEENTRNAFKNGVDFSAAGHEVNAFEPNYEQFDINEPSQFSGNATIANGMSDMLVGQTIVCGSDNQIPLGKGELIIRFNGSLTISFGSVGNRTITSDGSEDLVISDYFFKRATTLTITANANTTVSNFLYKTSKC